MFVSPVVSSETQTELNEDQAEEVRALAHSFTIEELKQLEVECPDCRTQLTTKIAEEQLVIIPDIEQIV